MAKEFEPGLGVYATGVAMIVGLATGAYLCVAGVTEWMPDPSFKKFMVGLVFLAVGVVFHALFVFGICRKANEQMKRYHPDRVQALETDNLALRNAVEKAKGNEKNAVVALQERIEENARLASGEKPVS